MEGNKKYPRPRLAKRNAADWKRVAEKVAESFPDNKVIVTGYGQRIKGKKKSK
ncbi:MAG: hypothetical protein AB3N16_07945 [Flavobacteriaceae bacterium]